MKKRVFLLTGLALLVLVPLALPFLVKHRHLQARLLAYAEQSIKGQVSVAAVGWRWLPLPALTLTGLRAENEAFRLVLPKVECILDPGIFLSGRIALVTARASAPDLTLKRYGASDSPFLATVPAFTLVTIKGGTLRLPGPQANGEGQPLAITDIDGLLSCRVSTVHFNGQAGDSGLLRRLTAIDLKLDLAQGDYQADLTGLGLDSSRLWPLAADAPSLRPVVRGLDFSAHLEGRRQGRASLRLKAAQDTAFTVQVKDQTMQVAGLDQLTVSGDGTAWSVEVAGLALNDPRLQLHGQVSHRPGAADGADWFIDLGADHIDLGAVRDRLLALFGDNRIAREVCGIVRGGEAVSARYLFEGGLADFQHLGRMKIWAEAKDVPVLIPDLHLALDRASGPIAIVDGQLTGKDLSATIDQSQGMNGELLLDLRDDAHAFRLDLDLDADLVNLQDVLSQIIPSRRFQDELYHFVAVSGRAQGHLRVGDDLRQLETRVEVTAAQAKGLYDRLAWPFTVQAARLHIEPGQVGWDGVQGTVGPQRLKASRGEVDWQGEPRLRLDGLDADLDLAALFEQGTLRTDTALLSAADLGRGRLEAIRGRASLTNTTLSGPLRQPQAWRYRTTITCPELGFRSPSLPELTSRDSRIQLDEQQAGFSGRFTLLDQDVQLTGRYRHRLLDHWHGELTATGEVGEALGGWLNDKVLLPEQLALQLPFRLDHLLVTNDEQDQKAVRARGTITALPLDKDAALEIDIERQAGRRRDSFTFRRHDGSGTLRYEEVPAERQRLLSWQGELAAETVEALFRQQLISEGRISGELRLHAEDEVWSAAGRLTANDIHFGSEAPLPQLAIAKLSLHGDEGRLSLEQGDFTLAGAPGSLTGTIASAGANRDLDLLLHLSRLPWETVKTLFDDYQRQAGESHSLLDTVRGRIAFDIEALEYAPKPAPRETADDRAAVRDQGETANGALAAHGKRSQGATDARGGAASNTSVCEQASDPHSGASAADGGPCDRLPAEDGLVFAPVQGSLGLMDKTLDLRIEQASLCGISMSGGWHYPKEAEADGISFASGQQPVFFEQTLPCLGFRQSLILGTFNLKGQLKGRPKHWRQGELSLSSAEGLIKRLTLLSKIFTAVNFTDLFTWGDQSTGDGEGLPYNRLELLAHVDTNVLTLDRAMIKGKGVNVSGRGTIELADFNSDLTFFIAPFKMVDSLITSLPLLGKALGGSKESILTFPVAVTGNLKNPEVSALAPSAVGSAALELLRDTITLPFRLFDPGPPGR